MVRGRESGRLCDVMKRLHIVPEKNECNGVYVVASLLAGEDGGIVALPCEAQMDRADEIWVHGAWLPSLWLSSLEAIRRRKPLVRMPHGSFSPVYLKRSGRLKKAAVAPIEKFILRRAARVVATCGAEAEWIAAYCKGLGRVQQCDIKRFFSLSCPPSPSGEGDSVRLLYLGRKHPLKGFGFLESAVARLNAMHAPDGSAEKRIELRAVESARGAEKEDAFAWCDCLVQPSESENFSLAVAEALSRGKRVVVTDGAPAWGEGDISTYQGKLFYLKGYAAAPEPEKTAMLADAIARHMRLDRLR